MSRFLMFFVMMIFALPATAQPGAQKAYEVENVKINLKNVNPVEARDKAFEAAQIKAFKALFRSLNNGETLEFDESRVPSLIEDFELIDEQIAPSRYAATYTFRFRRLASEEFARETQYEQGLQQQVVDYDAPYNPNQPQGYTGTKYSELYGQNNLRKTATRTKPPLLLPYWKSNGNFMLWGQGNRWQNTWRRLENKTETGRGFLLPIGDLSDMRYTSNGLPQGREAVEQLTARYQVDQIVIAVGEMASGSITTTLYASDERGIKLWKVIDSPIGPSTDPYSVAAGQIMAEIRGNSNPALTSRPPQVAVDLNRENSGQVPNIDRVDDEPFFQARQAPTQQVIRAKSRFQTPREWLELKESMIPANGVHQVRVISLTPKSAIVELHLSAPIQQVRRNLGNNNITLQETDGDYTVSFMGS